MKITLFFFFLLVFVISFFHVQQKLVTKTRKKTNYKNEVFFNCLLLTKTKFLLGANNQLNKKQSFFHFVTSFYS